ncbi:MAG: transcription-repair coupling factor [Planctomycetia bacterium]|nr:transcription-repair coupling factor [Planctomycetia bacterium]
MSTTVIRPTNLRDLVALLPLSPVRKALTTGQSGTIDGAWGSSAALATAAVAQNAECTLVVIAHPRDLDGWVGDLSGFLGLEPALFPAWDSRPGSDGLDDISGCRLRLIKQLPSDPPRVVLTTFQALIQPVPHREELHRNLRQLRVGDNVDPDELARWLAERGYQPVEAVDSAGQFSRRGGIFDVFAPDDDAPCRIELFGDEVESLRRFSPDTQRSLGSIDTAEFSGIPGLDSRCWGEGGSPTLPYSPPSPHSDSAASASATTGHFCDYLPTSSTIVLIETEELIEQGRAYHERISDSTGLFSVEGVFQNLLRFPSVKISALPAPGIEAAVSLRVESVERLSGEVARVRDELDAVAERDVVLIACQNDGERKRLLEVLSTGKLAQSDRLRLVPGRVRAGFRLVGDITNVVVLGGQEIFHRDDTRPLMPRRRLESRAIDSFLELNEGDLVVHVGHGIARFRGMQMLERETGTGTGKRKSLEEHLTLEFRDGVKLYVPVSKIDLVQKYVGGQKSDPELSKVGGVSWNNKKARVEQAVQDLAVEMLQLQAIREAQPGEAYPVDSQWQREFEASFPYQETPDQLTTLGEIKHDMERPRPMDRLVCGDVGYGKTELAIRAAFKAIDTGRQVAVLVPTTVLAEQHYRTFTSRISGYPFVVHCLSRFRSGSEQKRIVELLATGGVDVIIGTHRLLSADVRFNDLGLVIVDEEQRFGVEAKERLKRLRSQVDVLTLTATPIPRTLHLSLLGIRDISNLETPPPDRLAIETRIVRWDESLIKNAIVRELNREGQVYFVHNRVHDIETIRTKLKKIVPEARIAIAHGQMTDSELERGMLQFVRRDADILLATTIIESGLDIPSANTMFINEADHYGLADLHQLRGRVGRSKTRAYCYLVVDANRKVTDVAAKRLKAMEEFTSLGAGFKIALRDLEIRGAGNILGNEQSGHIATVGYELYCQLLENAVRTLKKLPLRAPLEVTVDLPWQAFLPREYVLGQRLRIEIYRRLGRVRKLDRLEEFRDELLDRFGPIPEPTEWLLRTQEMRIRATGWKIDKIYLEGPGDGVTGPTYAVLGYRGAQKIKQLMLRSGGDLKIVDDRRAYFKLAPTRLDAEPLYHDLRSLMGAAVKEQADERDTETDRD